MALSFEEGVQAMPQALYDDVIETYRTRAELAASEEVAAGYEKLIAQFEAARGASIKVGDRVRVRADAKSEVFDFTRAQGVVGVVTEVDDRYVHWDLGVGALKKYRLRREQMTPREYMEAVR